MKSAIFQRLRCIVSYLAFSVVGCTRKVVFIRRLMNGISHVRAVSAELMDRRKFDTVGGNWLCCETVMVRFDDVNVYDL